MGNFQARELIFCMKRYFLISSTVCYMLGCFLSFEQGAVEICLSARELIDFSLQRHERGARRARSIFRFSPLFQTPPPISVATFG